LTDKRHPYLGLTLGLVSGFLWGTTSIGARYLAHVREVDPAISVFFRFVVPLPLLYLACRLWAKDTRRFEARDLPRMLGLSFVGIFLMSDLAFYSTKYTTSINATVILTASAVLIGIIQFLKGVKVTRGQWVGVALGLVGVIFIGFAKNPVEEGLTFFTHSIGIILATLGSLSWAVYTVFGAGVVEKYGGMRITFWFMILGAIMQLPLALHAGLFDAARGFGAREWWVLLYMGVFPTGVAFACWIVALKYIDATTLGMTQYAGPPVNAVLTWLLLGDPILWQHYAGAALVIAGLHFATRRASPAAGVRANS
jgi:drug/metabolite transporter (DMT)-like permease